MAAVHSPSHKIGQIIGDALELSVDPVLSEVADKHGLYLDRRGPRAVRGNKRKLTWRDNEENSHDLDFVIERGGADSVQGQPVAFIEVAWRRYTKHSKNKAGEISNALLPLLNTHAATRPLLGAVVAGEWTAPALTAMSNQGLKVLHVPRPEIVKAFAVVGMDVSYGETTPREEVADQVSIWEDLISARKEEVGDRLRTVSPERYAAFKLTLDQHFERQVARVVVLMLHGTSKSFNSRGQAIEALRELDQINKVDLPFIRTELQVIYTNGDEIRATFSSSQDAVTYLERNV